MKTKLPRNEAFPERLRSLMAKEKISQTALANHLGISSASVSAYVCGKNEPRFRYLVMIAQYLDVSTDYLLGNTTVVKGKHRPSVGKTE